MWSSLLPTQPMVKVEFASELLLNGEAELLIDSGTQIRIGSVHLSAGKALRCKCLQECRGAGSRFEGQVAFIQRGCRDS